MLREREAFMQSKDPLPACTVSTVARRFYQRPLPPHRKIRICPNDLSPSYFARTAPRSVLLVRLLMILLLGGAAFQRRDTGLLHFRALAPEVLAIEDRTHRRQL